MDGTYPRMCYGVIDKYGLRCFYEYSNTRYYGTDDYRFKFVSLAPLYQPDDNYGNPPLYLGKIGLKKSVMRLLNLFLLLIGKYLFHICHKVGL